MLLKLKFRTQFPALVSVTSPLTLVKSGLSYAFGLDANAIAGITGIGSYVSASVAFGTPTALTTATPINLTSISLTAGDWDVHFEPVFLFAASTAYTQLVASISTTSATIDNSSGENYGSIASASNVPGLNTNISVRVGPRRMSLVSTTTVFGVLTQAFTASTLSGWGTLRARRLA